MCSYTCTCIYSIYIYICIYIIFLYHQSLCSHYLMELVKLDDNCVWYSYIIGWQISYQVSYWVVCRAIACNGTSCLSVCIIRETVVWLCACHMLYSIHTCESSQSNEMNYGNDSCILTSNWMKYVW